MLIHFTIRLPDLAFTRTVILLTIIVSFALQAKQTGFSKTEQSDSVLITYQWLSDQQPQKLSFSLAKEAVMKQMQGQKSYQPAIALRHVYVNMMKHAQTIDPKEARVDIRQQGKSIQVKVTSRSQQMIDKWQKLMSDKQEQAFDQYLQENHFSLYENHLGQSGIIPDHIRYIAENRSIMLPVAQALYEQLLTGSDARVYLNLVLTWVQSIPYDTLEDRLVSNGTGFFTPVEVLMNNLGDCDSKATLTASVLRSLLPNLSMVFVYLPDHAVLAVDLGQRAGEQNILVNGTPHVLLDPTGPAQLALGKLSDKSAQAIANGRYSVSIIP